MWAVLLSLPLLLQACGDAGPSPRDASLAHMQSWFAAADQGNRADTLCHGLGMLKHSDFSCAELLDYASRVDGSTRTIARISEQDCFQGVCGEFYQIQFSAFDPAGNEVEETALLKVDDGVYRTYWYRSSLMLAELASVSDDDRDQKDPEQVAYDALVALHPELYEFPPCYGVRPSSSNLAGDLMLPENLQVAAVEHNASACGDTFCFAFVGAKVAQLCPKAK